MTKNAVVC